MTQNKTGAILDLAARVAEIVKESALSEHEQYSAMTIAQTLVSASHLTSVASVDGSTVPVAVS